MQRCQSQLRAALDRLEAQCGAPCFFDGQMSHADVMTACMIGYLKLRLPRSFAAEKYPKLHALASYCELEDEFMKSRISPDETMPAKDK